LARQSEPGRAAELLPLALEQAPAVAPTQAAQPALPEGPMSPAKRWRPLPFSFGHSYAVSLPALPRALK